MDCKLRFSQSFAGCVGAWVWAGVHVASAQCCACLRSRPKQRMQLSDDEDDDNLLEELQEQHSEGDRRRKRGNSKKSSRRVAGGKRSKAFVPPIPLEYQRTDDGKFQKYKLPDDCRVYNRRTFVYSEENKVGSAVTEVPPPPMLFSDSLFKKAKAFMLDTNEIGFQPHG